jgi:hypothetical protein
MLKREKREKVLPQAPMGHPRSWLGDGCWMRVDGWVQEQGGTARGGGDDY